MSILKCVPEYDILSGNICLNTYKKTLNLNNYGSLFKVYSLSAHCVLESVICDSQFGMQLLKYLFHLLICIFVVVLKRTVAEQLQHLYDFVNCNTIKTV